MTPKTKSTRRRSWLAAALALCIGAQLLITAPVAAAVRPPAKAPGAQGDWTQSQANTSDGYWMVASDGGIFSYGAAKFRGSAGSLKLNKPIVGMASTPDGLGYWLVASDGGIFAYGDAGFFGSPGSLKLNKPIVAMSPTPDGLGYWLVASDGGIFAYGSAAFYGSTGAIKLNKPIVGMASTPDGLGYWLVASDGGIFAYGDAAFYGSTGAIKLNQPIVAMSPTPDGLGYWLVASDGGIFAYGTAQFHGSTGAIKLNKPVVGIAGALGSTLSIQVDAPPAGSAHVDITGPAGYHATVTNSQDLSVDPGDYTITAANATTTTDTYVATYPGGQSASVQPGATAAIEVDYAIDIPATTQAITATSVLAVTSSSVTIAAGATLPPVGGYIVASSGSVTGSGLVRRVSAISPGPNGTSVITTTPADIAQAMPTGRVDYEGDADSNLLDSIRSMTNTAQAESPISLNCIGTSSLQIKSFDAGMNGLHLSFHIKWGGFLDAVPQGGSAVATMNEHVTVTVSAGQGSQCTGSYELAKFPLPPIPIIPGALELVPEFTGGGGVSLSAEMSNDVTYHLDGQIKAGVSGTPGGGVSPVFSMTDGGSDNEPGANITLKAGPTARIDFLMDGIVGPYIEAGAYLNFKYSVTELPHLTLSASLDVGGGLTLASLWDLELAKATVWEQQLWASSSDIPFDLLSVPWSDGSYNVYYQSLLGAVGGLGSASITAGTLPPGLGLAPSSGVLSGTPSAAGNYPMTVQGIGQDGTIKSKSFTLLINYAPLQAITRSVPGGSTGNPYPTTRLAVQGGHGGVNWALTAGALPAGLSLSAAGVITGTPTAVGTFNPTFSATDSAAATVSVTPTLTIAAIPPASWISHFASAYYSPESGLTRDGDGGPAINAHLANPWATAEDSSGNVYISDMNQGDIRRVDSSGTIHTVAGRASRFYNYIPAFNGADAMSVDISPQAMVVDPQQNVVFYDYRSNLILRLNVATGLLNVLVGGGSSFYSSGTVPGTAVKLFAVMSAMATDSSGNIYFSDVNNSQNNEVLEFVTATNSVRRVVGTGVTGHSTDSGPATSVELNDVTSLALNQASNTLYVLDASNNYLRIVDLNSGNLTTVGAGNSPSSWCPSYVNYDVLPSRCTPSNFSWGVANAIAVDRYGSLIVEGDEQILRMNGTSSFTLVAGLTALGAGTSTQAVAVPDAGAPGLSTTPYLDLSRLENMSIGPDGSGYVNSMLYASDGTISVTVLKLTNIG